ncbi:conserved hypothetical protein [Candidatus Sulfopaludibacter sp. SbA4]|nr:conserved hypothetical protein [Candidatus Sulfopaludibacter sp. SbA4]
MPEKSKTSEPIVQTVWVDCPIAEAFRFFTEGFAEWWPLQAHSIHKEDAERCEIEPWPGGRVFERTREGKEEDWGAVIAWEPPGRLEFTWSPGTVEVEFEVEADGTRVTLIHRGWHRGSELSCAVTRFAEALRQQLVASY